MLKHLLYAVSAVMAAVSCGTATPLTITGQESGIIRNSPQVMRILTVDNAQDSLFLRQGSRNFNVVDINSADFVTLVAKMTATVTDPEVGGVGIAAPQVGIGRRLIVVQRFDKEGEPFEAYVNPYIVETAGELQTGPEGCLSVPDRRGDVPRYQEITVRYTDMASDRIDQPREITEVVKGYTAVIFQHEIDHLDGIIYTDRIVK